MLYQKVLSLFHGNLSILVHVLSIIINKIHVKVLIAQKDTDLSLYLNVLKWCAFVKYFETLILSLIQDKSVSFRAITTFTYILFILYRTCKRTLKFPWNSNKTLTIAFLYKIFSKSIHIDDNRLISWYRSFGLGPFHQPEGSFCLRSFVACAQWSPEQTRLCWFILTI